MCIGSSSSLLSSIEAIAESRVISSAYDILLLLLYRYYYYQVRGGAERIKATALVGMARDDSKKKIK